MVSIQSLCGKGEGAIHHPGWRLGPDTWYLCIFSPSAISPPPSLPPQGLEPLQLQAGASAGGSTFPFLGVSEAMLGRISPESLLRPPDCAGDASVQLSAAQLANQVGGSGFRGAGYRWRGLSGKGGGRGRIGAALCGTAGQPGVGRRRGSGRGPGT